jgi:hypothetical protein
MVEINFRLCEHHLAFLAGFFLAQCFSKDRDTRKAAIQNYGALYPLLSESEKEEMVEVEKMAKRMVESPELLAEIAEDFERMMDKFSGDAH